MGISKRTFGVTKGGKETFLYTITNKNGMKAAVTNFGAILTQLIVPDAKGGSRDVVLGFDSVTGYEGNDCFFGSTIGRNANRIGGASFEIDGVKYELAANENGNNLHTDKEHGFHKAIWNAEVLEAENAVKFTYRSPDGENGFPGNLDMSVTYTLQEDNAIRIDYDGVSDKKTVINVNNHSYFNLEGHDSGIILDHVLWIDADGITAVDAESIPTGEILPVEGTPFDFREEKPIGRDIEQDNEQLRIGCGYDHNFALNTDGSMKKIAQVKAPVSGRVMEVFTDCVGVQLYTGNFIENTQIGKDGKAYDKRFGFCLETQFYPDAVNHENFASPILKAGETYHTETIYRFS